MDLKTRIRDVPDFPQPGILFRDITPLLADPVAFGAAVAAMAERWRGEGVEVVAGVESRGFLFGAPLALALGLPFVPVRKAGKLPHDTLRHEYALEYGTATLEVHRDAVASGRRVLVVDDVLATGGTAAAAARLIGMLGAEVVGFAFLMELGFLNGRAALNGRAVQALLEY
jgi:adenine phosphoribosyltransferase